MMSQQRENKLNSCFCVVTILGFYFVDWFLPEFFYCWKSEWLLDNLSLLVFKSHIFNNFPVGRNLRLNSGICVPLLNLKSPIWFVFRTKKKEFQGHEWVVGSVWFNVALMATENLTSLGSIRPI